MTTIDGQAEAVARGFPSPFGVETLSGCEGWEEMYASPRSARPTRASSSFRRRSHHLEVPELPELEDLAAVTEARGVGTTYALLAAYDRLLQGFDRIRQYHFELNALGYGAYLVFYELCRQLFPGASDQAIATMVSGIEVLTLRPDEELRRLARKALEPGVGAAVKAANDEDDLRAALAQTEASSAWLADFDETKDPWFHFSFGNGLAHHDRSWVDDTSVPIRTVASYVSRLEAGEDVSRPHAAVVAERDRITEEYRSLLPRHRYLTGFWNKVRKFGALLAADGFLAEGEDVFFLRHDEVREALEELRLYWSSYRAGTPRGPSFWPPLVARRKRIYERMREWSPPPALGRVPVEIADPSLIMLWGITPERVASWLGAAEDDDELSGVAGSPGVAEGPARVILRADELAELEAGEILVAPSTSTSWTPVFGTIAAAVLDTGGIMCHAAIVACEHGLPAVVGTGTATKRIKTGDRVRVDANNGVVTILER
jgi:pyruvate,water dikinase